MDNFVYYVQIILAGMGGALVRSLVVHRGSILLWHRWTTVEGKHGIDLGIFSSLIIGAAVGLLVDQSPMTAFSWAITGSYLIEEIVKVRSGEPLHKLKENESEFESTDDNIDGCG